MANISHSCLFNNNVGSTCVSTGVEQRFLTILSPLSSLTEIEENSAK